MLMGIGDWGLGIGPIPNPQSPSPNDKKNLIATNNLFKSNNNII
jgi:hypothetical protein